MNIDEMVQHFKFYFCIKKNIKISVSDKECHEPNFSDTNSIE